MASISLAQLIYRGELRSPLKPADVQDAVAQLFRIPPAQALALLQSSQVVLKKNLTAAELLPYFERLSQLGLVVTIEPMAEPKPAVPEPVSSQAPPALKIEAAPVVETITCPKCSHVQPKRTLCLGCGVDMPRFAAAQIAERQEAVEQKYKPNVSMGVNRVQLDEVNAPPIFSLAFIVPVVVMSLSAISGYKAANNPEIMARFSKHPHAAQESNASAKEDVVVMYSTTGCPYCHAAREWFAKHNVEYVECNTETDSACNEAYQNLEGAQGVPTFVLGSEIQSGYSEDWLEQRFLRR